MARLDWEAFVRGLREEQDELREELRPYEAGTLRVHEGPSGGKLVDFTNKRSKQIKAEIASIQRIIDAAAAERGLRNA
jgi:hypothetical protein